MRAWSVTHNPLLEKIVLLTIYTEAVYTSSMRSLECPGQFHIGFGKDLVRQRLKDVTTNVDSIVVVVVLVFFLRKQPFHFAAGGGCDNRVIVCSNTQLNREAHSFASAAVIHQVLTNELLLHDGKFLWFCLTITTTIL